MQQPVQWLKSCLYIAKLNFSIFMYNAGGIYIVSDRALLVFLVDYSNYLLSIKLMTSEAFQSVEVPKILNC